MAVWNWGVEMVVHIKRADSVTSIFLFLFNVFLGQQGISELPVKKILRLLEPFGKSETSIRMGLSRGVRNGLLVNFKRQGEVYYGITSKAGESFKYWWQIMKRFQDRVDLQLLAWDGHWTLVNTRQESVDDLVAELKKLGFGSLNKTVCISPYNLTGRVWEIANNLSVTPKIYVFRSVLEKSQSSQAIIKEIWDPGQINRAYRTYIAGLDSAYHQISGDGLRGQGLPILHLYGMRLFELIQVDPQLPLQLLPTNWLGIEAFKRFNEIREHLLPGATQYVSEIINA